MLFQGHKQIPLDKPKIWTDHQALQQSKPLLQDTAHKGFDHPKQVLSILFRLGTSHIEK
jgi:hypothetical protein